MSADCEIIEADAATARAMAGALADVLVDCVEGGASVSFMAPFGRAMATAFFERVADEVEAGSVVLLVARRNGEVVGTVQLGLDMPPNQPHRADVKKLLVHRRARGHGVGEALMRAAERAAQARARSLLVLDTASDEANRLYRRLGWVQAGIIPDYALLPAGGLCDTTIYWKKIDGGA